MQTQAGFVRSTMPPLSVLVRLPELRTQGAINQYAYLPPLCYQSALMQARLPI